MNTFKTLLLLTGLMALFIFVGRMIGGQTGMIYAFVMACVMNFVSYWASDKIVLKVYNAKPVTEADSPALYRIVRRLSLKANIPLPRIYIIDSDIPNAFATGRNPEHAAIAATSGILDRLNEAELEGVLGHELSHVFNRDILISTVAATVAGAIMMLAQMARWGMMFGGIGGGRDRENRNGFLELLVLALLAPLAATLIQMAISRNREYDADHSGAELTGHPLALAHALQKIETGNARAEVPLTNNPVTAHLFIMNPLRKGGLAALFSTHPPTAERIKRLEAMAGTVKLANSPQIVY